MARVTVVFEDKEASGGPHIDIVVESDPPLPIAKVTDPRWRAGLESDEDLDVNRATKAQLAARMAVGEVAGQAGAALIMVRPPGWEAPA